MSEKIHIIENFISEEDSKKLIKYFSKLAFPGPDGKTFFVSLANEAVYFDMRHDPEFLEVNDYVHNLLNRIENKVMETYNLSIELKSANFVEMKEGAILPEHTDMGGTSDPVNGKRIDDDDDFEFSALIYLNNDFEGGFLNFPQESIKLKTGPGTLVYFSGQLDLPHEVTEITKGSRKSIASFLRRKKVI
jgi:predicted 2-oxoglutarate/Fe(II)-dependent dioxygenase YbiX